MPYLAPRNLNASSIAEVTRRLVGLLRCLEGEINSTVAVGELPQDLQRYRTEILTKLEDEGWTFSFDAGPRFKARWPGHPRPFLRRLTTPRNGTAEENGGTILKSSHPHLFPRGRR